MILAIYGTGGTGREVHEIASSMNGDGTRWSEIVFIDDVTEERSLYGSEIMSLPLRRSASARRGRVRGRGGGARLARAPVRARGRAGLHLRHHRSPERLRGSECAAGCGRLR